jgi:hypothetical protein
MHDVRTLPPDERQRALGKPEVPAAKADRLGWYPRFVEALADCCAGFASHDALDTFTCEPSNDVEYLLGPTHDCPPHQEVQHPHAFDLSLQACRSPGNPVRHP